MEQAEYALMDAAEGGMWWYRALHAHLLDAIAGIQGPVLDAGCGTGGLLAALRARVNTVSAIGLEFDRAAAHRAQEKGGSPVACGSVNELPFADTSFGVVVLADVLCHAAVDPGRALAEAKRVLRPGGRVIVNMPAYAWLMSAHDARVRNARRMNARQTASLLALAGFRGARVRYWNGLLLPLMMIQRKLLTDGNSASDVAPFPPWLNATLHGITRIERRLPFALPAGGSVLAIAEKP